MLSILVIADGLSLREDNRAGHGHALPRPIILWRRGLLGYCWLVGVYWPQTALRGFVDWQVGPLPSWGPIQAEVCTVFHVSTLGHPHLHDSQRGTNWRSPIEVTRS